MKRLTLFLASAFLFASLALAARPIKLGPAKNPQFVSSAKLFVAEAPQVPLQGEGMAHFRVRLLDAAGQPLGSGAKVTGRYWMPGMEMTQSPPLSIKSLGQGNYELGMEVSMPGLWKVELNVENQSKQDLLLIKFVTE